jgi:lysophospholipase L1-like esterase
MNTNPSAIRILCFGDSNTWGRSGASVDRYPANIRWTGLLQQKLGDNYEIIEEGVRSRTTNLDDDDPNFPGRNGLTYLRPCLASHQPLDIVILWLGTNDLKEKFNRSAIEVANALAELITFIKNMSNTRQGTPSKIIVVSPPLVKEGVLKPKTTFGGAGEKAKMLAGLYRQLAEKEGCSFVDLSQEVVPGEFDGVHLEPDEHPRVADILYEKIQELCR